MLHESEKAAADYDGVVIKDHAFDAEATARCRDAIRIERLGGVKPKRPLGEGDLGVASGRFACSCSCDLGPWSGNWKAAAQAKVVSPLTFGPHIRIHPDLELREHICRECGSLLEAEVVRKGDDSLVSVALEA